jgi:hypothetical protein
MGSCGSQKSKGVSEFADWINLQAMAGSGCGKKRTTRSDGVDSNLPKASKAAKFSSTPDDNYCTSVNTVLGSGEKS